VVVVEANPSLGGAVRTAEVTLPGFRHDLFSAFYPLAVTSPAMTNLGLERYGLVWKHAPVVLAHPMLDGRCAAISSDIDFTAATLSTFSERDGDSWRSMIEAWQRVSAPLLDTLFRPFPPITAGTRLVRSLGALGSLRLARSALLPIRRMADELFTGEGARLLLGGNALHADLSPESAGSGLYGWLLACLAQTVGFPVPEGGAGALTSALIARLTDRGGEVMCGTRVEGVIVRSGRACGVRTATAGMLDARRAVIADVSAPALYHTLIDPAHLPASLLEDVSRFEWDSATVKVDWALDAAIPWTAETARSSGTVHVADSFDNLTEFAAQIAMGQLPSRPFLIMGQQSKADSTRSPAGTETAWAYTHVPREVRLDAAEELAIVSEQTGSATWVDGFVDRIESRIERLAPGFRAHIIGRHVASPQHLYDLDANLDGGAIGGGSAQMHQQAIFRPVPGSGRPETPITSLYLASASTHPGGGVHGAGGRNAARAALSIFPRVRSVALGRGSVHRHSDH
jgi:phytoene dehydrogenase-like protein